MASDLPAVVIDGSVPRTVSERCWRIYEWAQGTSLFTREQSSRLLTLAQDSETIADDDPYQWENEDRMLAVVVESVPDGFELVLEAGDVLIVENEEGS